MKSEDIDQEYIDLVTQSKQARNSGNYAAQRQLLQQIKEFLSENEVSEETLQLAAYL